MSYHPGDLIADLDQARGGGLSSQESGANSHESRVTSHA
jgi:hypothetical protein